MVLSTEIARTVEIPPSLPNISDMERIEGSILLKDVTADSNTLRVDGDLLWRGYFESESGTSECLWEGAEYFSEALPLSSLRGGDDFLLDPVVLGIETAEKDDNRCEIKFTIRWREAGDYDDSLRDETPVVEIAVPVEEVTASPDIVLEEIASKPFPNELEKISNEFNNRLAALDKSLESKPEPFVVEENNEAECDIRVKEKTESKVRKTADAEDKEEVKEAKAVKEDTEEIGAELRVEIEDFRKESSPPYKLRFYRVQEGEELGDIAARLSFSVGKLWELNSFLEGEDNHSVNKLLRLPVNG